MVKVLSNIPVKFIKDQGTERKINKNQCIQHRFLSPLCSYLWEKQNVSNFVNYKKPVYREIC